MGDPSSYSRPLLHRVSFSLSAYIHRSRDLGQAENQTGSKRPAPGPPPGPQPPEKARVTRARVQGGGRGAIQPEPSAAGAPGPTLPSGQPSAPVPVPRPPAGAAPSASAPLLPPLPPTPDGKEKGREVVDVFGRAHPAGVGAGYEMMECEVCQRRVAMSRFAAHLAKCMGQGRAARRGANTRN